MEVAHDDEAKNGNGNADFFHAFIRGDARGHVVRNRLIENCDKGATNENKNS